MGYGTYVYDNAMYLISGSFCRFIISLFFIVIPFSGIDVVVERISQQRTNLKAC